MIRPRIIPSDSKESMANKKATITDVAKKAGVSTGTVSAVLNDRPTVRAQTRERVVAAIRQLGYQPSPSARMLSATQHPNNVLHKSIGLIVKEMDSPFYADLTMGVHSLLTERGYTMFVCSSEGDYEEEGNLIDVIRSRFVNGVIIAPIVHEEVDLTHLFMLKQAKYPFVLFEGVPGLQVNVVDIDNVKASHIAVRYLIENGHERIMHVAGPPYTSHSRDRILGVQKAFSHSRLVYTDDIIVSGGARLEDGYRAGMEMFKGRSADERPTAVTCFNDLVAMGVMRALAELGLRTPDDVSVIGFDDIQSAAYLSVPLTTVRQPTREMGRCAAELLIAQLEAPGDTSAKRITLEAELVLRDSTRPLVAA